MDPIIEAFAGIFPCSWFSEKTGLPENCCAVIATLVCALIVCGLVKLFYLAVNSLNYCRAARDLSPWFDYQKVKSSRELFIPTRFQNQSPTREDEPAFTHKFVVNRPLIPFFLKTAFNEKKESDKYYLLLADSGMGKTTFMINLYLTYNSFFNFNRKNKMRLYPLGDSRILDMIRTIEVSEARNTILLLDAFDEDKNLLPPEIPDGLTEDERFRKRLDEILEVVRDFKEVIITSRTQYFPGQEEQPYELTIPRFDERGFHKLAKLYVTPFNEKEIKRYLYRKFGRFRFWNREKRKNAFRIIKKVPKLMVRPMLLNYIDLLATNRREYKDTYAIYEELVARWIDREAIKRKHKEVDREQFKIHLEIYSQQVALRIYEQRQKHDMLCLDKQTAVALATDLHLNLKDYEVTGQSLLTRDANLNWKFAHKSILEYFIANEVFKNELFRKTVDFTGMDLAWQFISERLFGDEFVNVPGGEFKMGSPSDEAGRSVDERQHHVTVDGFYIMKYTVTNEQFKTFVDATGYKTEWIPGGGNKLPVNNVSWNDANAYCEWLSKTKCWTFRLPTEAEWEYACRAGSEGAYCFGNDETKLTEYAWFDQNSKTIHEAGKKKPNKYGIYDMHGNLWEWCGDWFDEYPSEAVSNPKGPESGSFRVVRGGSWISGSGGCRCADRFGYDPGYRYVLIGFRVVSSRS